ncbi:MAG: sigma-70 family RNA polymerase sigma factor [Ignavibacteriales bacterium]|nr:sigma-70 family RNA polymerase sigma factor [Ignavibacteriales bacterium]
MTWEELYPICKEQAYWSVLRYDPRRSDKIQELICQAFEKYQRDIAASKEIKKQDYKCFVTQRTKQLDQRSVVKGGGAGTSTMDPLGYFRRRNDSTTSVVQFDDWMTGSVRNKQVVDDSLAFNVDFKSWLEKLNESQRRVLDLLIEGYKASKIAELLKISTQQIRARILELKRSFVRFFHIREHKSLCLT